MSKKYKIKYDIEVFKNGITESEIDRNTQGLTDAIFVASILKGEDHNSYHFISVDGDYNKSLTYSQVFAMWSALAINLYEHPDCEYRMFSKQILINAIESIRSIVMPKDE